MGDKYSSMAIVSFVSGILCALYMVVSRIGDPFFRVRIIGSDPFFSQIIFCVIGAFTIIFGIIGLIQIKKKNLKGKWLAIVGIVFGVLAVISFIIFLNRRLGLRAASGPI